MPILGLNQPKKSAEEIAKERSVQITEWASRVARARFLDTEMFNNGYDIAVLYCFLVEFTDGSRELREGRKNDPWILALLPKVTW